MGTVQVAVIVIREVMNKALQMLNCRCIRNQDTFFLLFLFFIENGQRSEVFVSGTNKMYIFTIQEKQYSRRWSEPKNKQ